MMSPTISSSRTYNMYSMCGFGRCQIKLVKYLRVHDDLLFHLAGHTICILCAGTSGVK